MTRQLVDAETLHRERSAVSQSHAASVKQRIDKFNSQQHDIDRRLMVITRSDTSDEAVQKFDASMSKLKQLDITKGYVDLLAEIQHLRSETFDILECRLFLQR